MTELRYVWQGDVCDGNNDEEEIEDNDDDDECVGDDDDGKEGKGGEVTDRLWQIWPKVGDPRKRRFLKLCLWNADFKRKIFSSSNSLSCY